MKIHKHNLTKLITKKDQYHKITNMYKYLHFHNKLQSRLVIKVKVSYRRRI